MLLAPLYYSARTVEPDVDNVELTVEPGVDDVEFPSRFGDHGWSVSSWVLLCGAGRPSGPYRRHHWKHLSPRQILWSVIGQFLLRVL